MTVLPLATMLTLGAGVALARTVPLVGNFSPENGTKSLPIGTVKGTLNTKTDLLSYSINYTGLSGPVTAAHFHGPATPGRDAGVLVPIAGPYHTGMTGRMTITVAQAKTILAGKSYVNLHTAAEPNGEARAQINAE